jgi:predicted DNA-binding transcriptional regulator AlpA
MARVSGIPLSEMKNAHSTADAARIIGVSKSTLLRWLADDIIPEPKRILVAGVSWRAWAKDDIEAARKVKASMRRGPKPRQKQ